MMRLGFWLKFKVTNENLSQHIQRQVLKFLRAHFTKCNSLFRIIHLSSNMDTRDILAKFMCRDDNNILNSGYFANIILSCPVWSWSQDWCIYILKDNGGCVWTSRKFLQIFHIINQTYCSLLQNIYLETVFMAVLMHFSISTIPYQYQYELVQLDCIDFINLTFIRIAGYI